MTIRAPSGVPRASATGVVSTGTPGSFATVVAAEPDGGTDATLEGSADGAAEGTIDDAAEDAGAPDAAGAHDAAGAAADGRTRAGASAICGVGCGTGWIDT